MFTISMFPQNAAVVQPVTEFDAMETKSFDSL